MANNIEVKLEVISRNSSLVPTASVRFGTEGGSFGRGTENDLQLPDPEREVSGQHGRVYFQDGEFFLQDTSTNGICIKESPCVGRVEEDAACPFVMKEDLRLHNGLVFEAGPYTIRVSRSETKGASESLSIDNELENIISDTNNPVDYSSFDPLQVLQQEPGLISENESKVAVSEQSYSSLGAFFEEPKMKQEKNVMPTYDESFPEPESCAVTEESPCQNVESIPENWFDTPPASDPIDKTTGEYGSSIESVSGTSECITLAGGEVSSEELLAALEDKAGLQHGLEARQEKYANNSSAAGIGVPICKEKRLNRELVERIDDSTISKQERNKNSFSQSEDLILQLAKNLGLSQSYLEENTAEDLTKYLTILVKESLQTIINMLMARSECKNKFRAEQTILQKRENNPLKFCPNVDTALHLFFGNSSTEFMGVVDALREANNDLRNHQIALLSAMNEAFNNLVATIDPQKFINSEESGFAKSIAHSFNKQSKAWSNYEKFYRSNVVDSNDAFHRLFGEKFSEAYENAVNSLSNTVDAG